MATKNKAKEAVTSADEYINSEKNEQIDGLINKINTSEFKNLSAAVAALAGFQKEILELMKTK